MYQDNEIDLYNIKRSNGDWLRLTAYLKEDGSVLLEGQDFTTLAEDMFGDEEFEYQYYIDKENVEKLKIALDDEDILNGLYRFFHGEILNEDFQKMCASNDILIQYNSI